MLLLYESSYPSQLKTSIMFHENEEKERNLGFGVLSWRLEKLWNMSLGRGEEEKDK